MNVSNASINIPKDIKSLKSKNFLSFLSISTTPQGCKHPFFHRIPGRKSSAGSMQKNFISRAHFPGNSSKKTADSYAKSIYTEKWCSQIPEIFKKRGLRWWFFCIEKIWHEKLWFSPHFCRKQDLAAQKIRIDPAMIFSWLNGSPFSLQNKFGSFLLRPAAKAETPLTIISQLSGEIPHDWRIPHQPSPCCGRKLFTPDNATLSWNACSDMLYWT